MSRTLDECRWLYNHLLKMRKTSWEERKEGLSYYDQIGTLPGLKIERPALKQVYAQVLQNVAVRIDLAFKNFFRRAQAGEKPGYPRFRGVGRYDSFCYPQAGRKGGHWLTEEGKVHLSKIGDVHIVLHRPIEGTVKTCCVKRSSTGKWYVTFSCEVETQPLPECSNQVGIDVGLTSFATLSNGEVIDNPRFFRKEEKQLAKANRKLSKAEKGTPKRKRRRKVVARVHERVRFKRDNFAHQHSRKIVNANGVIAVEDLSVNRMVHNNCLAKSISDAAWSKFTSFLSYKAVSAGRMMVRVNPAYTSQDCSRCGHRQKMPLSERVFVCPRCNLHIGRDLNASKNILRLGLQSLGLVPRSSPL